MNTHPDFEVLLRLLEKRRVEYMIVGGYAVAYHGYPLGYFLGTRPLTSGAAPSTCST
jgi:hypothetical protein